MHSSKEIWQTGERLFSNPETSEYKVWLDSMLATFGSRSRTSIDGVWMKLLTARQAEEAEQIRRAALREAKEVKREAAIRERQERGPNRATIFLTKILFQLVGVALIVATWSLIPEPARQKALILGSQTWVYVFLGLLIMGSSFVVTCFTALPIIIVLRAGIDYAVNLYFMGAMRTLRPAFVYMINILILSSVLKGFYYLVGSYFPWAEYLFWLPFVYLMVTGFWRCGKTPENWVDFIDTQHRHLTPEFRFYLAERAQADGTTYCFMD